MCGRRSLEKMRRSSAGAQLPNNLPMSWRWCRLELHPHEREAMKPKDKTPKPVFGRGIRNVNQKAPKFADRRTKRNRTRGAQKAREIAASS